MSPSLQLTERGEAPAGASGHGQGQFRRLAEQGPYLLRGSGRFFYRRFYRRFALSPKEGRFCAPTLPD